VDYVDRLAHFAAAIRYPQLPASVRDRAELVLLDTLGVIGFGAQDPVMVQMRRSLVPGNWPCRLPGTHHTADPARAAFFNAASCTVAQIDEGYRPSRGHPAIHVIPAVLAVAEESGAQGDDVMSSIVAGYEVGARLGVAFGSLHEGVHPHGTWGMVAAAAAIAKLFGGAAPEIVAAMDGAAALALVPPARTMVEGTTIHHYFAGVGARTAVEVGYGVRDGVTTTRGTLQNHYAPRCSTSPDFRRLLDGIEDGATRYLILDNYFKFHPVCAHTLAAIDAIDAIKSQRESRRPVSSISVRTYAEAAKLSEASPQTALAAKFSLPYVVAARWLDSMGSILFDRQLDDDRLCELMSKVTVIHDPGLDARYPAARPAIVTVQFQDGTTLTEEREYHYGDGGRLARSAVIDKFHRLLSPVLGVERAKELEHQVRRLPAAKSIDRMMKQTVRPLAAT